MGRNTPPDIEGMETDDAQDDPQNPFNPRNTPPDIEGMETTC
jgi:hypothetical protein